LLQYISRSIKYPDFAAKNKEKGKVNVEFVVEKDGTISFVEIAKGISRSLDNEALRVVRTMPKWNPGYQKGEAIRASYTVPISFKLKKTPANNNTTISENHSINR